MSYRRVIKAALNETKNRFHLAEALALDIPPKRRGPTAAGEHSVTDMLEEARIAIIEAGGEPKTIATLSDHRLTALWASTEPGHFSWLPGVSFTAHNLARGMGLSYEEFAALPDVERSIEALREPAHETSPEIPAPRQPVPVLPVGGRQPSEPEPVMERHLATVTRSPWDELNDVLEQLPAETGRILTEAGDTRPTAKQRPRLCKAVKNAHDALDMLRDRLGVPVAS